MLNFIECLLKGHRDTDKKAMLLYDKAAKIAATKAVASGRRKPEDGEVASELETLLCEQLADINLQDHHVYDDLVNKAIHWQATVKNAELRQFCSIVRSTLSGVLPDYRARQPKECEEKCAELTAACREYLDCVAAVIEREKEKSIGMRSQNHEYVELKEHDYNLHQDDVEETNNKKLKKARQQYDIVNIMLGLLVDRTRSPYASLQKIKEICAKNNKLIASSRDAASKSFISVLHGVVKIGGREVSQHSGLWNRKSRVTGASEEIPALSLQGFVRGSKL